MPEPAGVQRITPIGAPIGTTRIPAWLVAHPDVRGRGPLALWSVMAPMALKTRQCWPGHAYLAERTGLSERQVIRSIALLVEVGALREVPAQRQVHRPPTVRGGTIRVYELAGDEPFEQADRVASMSSGQRLNRVTPASRPGDIHVHDRVTPVSKSNLDMKALERKNERGKHETRARRAGPPSAVQLGLGDEPPAIVRSAPYQPRAPQSAAEMIESARRLGIIKGPGRAPPSYQTDAERAFGG